MCPTLSLTYVTGVARANGSRLQARFCSLPRCDRGPVPARVAARKAAASKVLGVLEEEEARDVTAVDLDDVMTRFQNLEGKRYSPGSLNTYLSRVKSMVEDFKRFRANPLGFKPSVEARGYANPRVRREGRRCRRPKHGRTSSGQW